MIAAYYMKMRGLYLCLLSALALSTSASAQMIRGSLSDSASRTPVPGAVVLLVGENDVVAGRALTNDRGEFQLRAPSLGAYRVRTLRIGFRPVVTAPFSMGLDRDTTMSLRLASVPYSLREVKVTGRGECKVRPDSGAEIARVWELARTALLATSLSEQQRIVKALMIKWDRTYDVHGWRIRADSAYEVENYSVRAFRAVSTEKLEKGWIQPEPDGLSFFAPDADILLSEFFSGSHCIYLKDGDPRSREDPFAEIDQGKAISRIGTAGRIGLGFQPVSRDRVRNDITGTLWLDRSTAELVGLEFSYTNLPEAMTEVGAGGRVDFRRLPNGSWIVSQWLIRMPVFRRRLGERVETVDRVMTSGGGVLAATRGNDTLWTVPRVELQGVVVDSQTHMPIGGARVSLAGTRVKAVTGTDGRFGITGLLPRSYLLAVRTPVADSLDVPARESDISIGRRGRAVTIGMPSEEALVRGGCDSIPRERPGIVAGFVRTSTGLPAANTKISVRWLRVTALISEAIASKTEFHETVTNDKGGFQFCALPVDHLLLFEIGELAALPGSEFKVRIPSLAPYVRQDFIAP